MVSPLRVLHFYKTALPDTMGGTQQFIDQLARGASRRGVKVDVLSLTTEQVPPTIEMSGYTVHRARQDFELASMGVSLPALVRFHQLVRDVDVIHYHYPWPFMDLAHFVARVNKPAVVTYHADIVRQKSLLRLYRPLQSWFLGRADRIVATSPNYAATSEVLQRYTDKVRVIPIGLDQSSYPQPAPERIQAWRERLGQRYFLFVGVLRYYKGLHVLVQALEGTDIQVAVVGSGPFEKQIKKQAEGLGLKNIHFLGALPEEDKAALLALCYGVVLPSQLRSEALGVSLIEGAMYGKPMISTELGTGTSFVNLAGQTGLVVPPDNPQALRQAMARLWQHPEQAAEMGRRAVERYQSHFTAEQMVDSYVKLYREVLRLPVH